VFLLYGNVPCQLLTVGWTVAVAVLFVLLVLLVLSFGGHTTVCIL